MARIRPAKPTRPNKVMRSKKLRMIRPRRKRRKRSTKKGKNIKKIVLQLQVVIPSLLLEKTKKTLAKLLGSAIIRRTITQEIALSLSQKTSCSLGNFYDNDY